MSDDLFLDYAGDTGSYVFPGGDGYDTIVGVWTTGTDVVFDLRNDTLDSIEQLEIGSLTYGAGPATGGRATMKLYAHQIPVWFIGNEYDRPSVDIFEISMGAGTTLDLSNVGIDYFGRGDHISVVGDGDAESIIGSWASDVILGRGGKDSIDGGDGWDTADYSERSKRIEVTLRKSQWADVSVGGKTEDSLRNIEAIFAGSGNDKLTGDSRGNLFSGGLGKDSMNGAGGVDTVDYSDRSKKVEVTLDKSYWVTVKVGGVAEDKVRNFENIIGGTAGDVLTGDSRDNEFSGGRGKDSIDGAGGIDLADYSDMVKSVQVTLKGSNWADVFVNGKLQDHIRNIEKLLGGYGDDTLRGDGAANTLQGGVGHDRLDGRGGIDTADYSDRPFAIAVDLDGANVVDVIVNGVAEDRTSRIENIIGSFRDDAISGDAGSNVLDSGDGKDTLFGDGGVDTLKGGAGDDDFRVTSGTHVSGVIDGGSGSDLLKVDDHSGSYVTDLRALIISSIEYIAFGDPGAGGTATIVMNGDQFVTQSWVTQATIVGSGQTDILTVHSKGALDLSDMVFQNFSGHVSIVGHTPGESITGSVIADSIAGGAGRQHLYYSTGYDTLDGGGAEDDDINFYRATGAVSLTLNGSADSVYTIGGVSSGIVRNIEYVTGTANNDIIIGDGNDNRFSGNGGIDTLDGGDGIDTLYFDWATGLDVDLAAGTYRTAGYPFSPIASTISNFENVIGSGNISGDEHANVLEVGSYGFAGSTLSGRGGDDHIIGSAHGGAHDAIDGGAGEDTLTGGAGDDTFIFATLTDSGAGATRDTITDFDTGTSFWGEVGNDVIDVSAIYAGDLVYRGTSAFNGIGQLRVRADGSDVIVDVNATGDLAADFSIRLSGVKLASMGADDFIL